MNKKYIAKYNLQEAVKRFQQINEYTFITQPLMLSEEGEEDEQNANPQDGGQQPQGMTQGNNDQMPSDPNGAQPPMNDMGGDNGEPMGNNPMGGQPDNMEMGAQPEQPDNGMGMGSDEEFDFEEETDVAEEGDEVIDVDDLTQSQEATEIKLDNFGEKFDKMMSFLDKVTQAIELSDKKIDDLRQEFEKRNPTEEEKLNLRSQASYPYSETPKGYWKEKMESNPHYNVIYDNEVSTADEPERFEITTDDVENINAKEVADSFDIDKRFKLEDFFNF